MWKIIKRGGRFFGGLVENLLISSLAILCFPWMFFRESDVRKMNALTDGFLEDICRQADAHKELLDLTEIIILSTFIVSEFYFKFSRDNKRASKLLDRYITICSNKTKRTIIENATSDELLTLKNNLEQTDFEASFVSKARERYMEFRSVLYHDNQLVDKSFFISSTKELAKHFFIPLTHLDDTTRRVAMGMFGLSIAKHIDDTIKAFTH